MSAAQVLPAKFRERKLDDHVKVKATFLPEEYGRGLDHSHIKKIVSNFDERAFGRVIVSMRDDGRFAIIDGNHRREAALHLGIIDIPCTVFLDLTQEEEAELFVHYNMTKNLTALNIEKGLIAQRDKGAIERRQVLKRNGLDWAFKGCPGHVTCASAIKKVYETHGLTILADVVRILVHGFGSDSRRAFIAPTIEGTTLFWIRYRYTANDERLLSQMHLTDALDLMIRARKLATAFGETTATGFGRALLELYNKGLRTNTLDDWPDYFLSEKARATASDRARKGIETRRARGDDFSEASRKGSATRKTNVAK
jgi:hypothetical protein